jgi:hypothetical protein
MNTRALLLAILCLASFPAIARAQERGQVGVTMGFPTAAGLIWHATDRIAIRPEITFSQVTSKAELTLPNASSESTDRSLGLGASLLWYVGSADGNVRPYVSPRIIYSRLTEDHGDDGEPVGTLAVIGSFGVQYTPSRRFGLYGEVGFGREHTEKTRIFPDLTVTTSVTSWSTRSAVGVVFYFGS